MPRITLLRHEADPSAVWKLCATLVISWRSLLTIWRKRRAFRLDLERLLETSPHLINDLGLTPSAAREEIKKPFWVE